MKPILGLFKNNPLVNYIKQHREKTDTLATSNLKVLPKELIIYCLSFLKAKDIYNFSLASYSCKQISEVPKLLEEILRDRFPNQQIVMPSQEDIKAYKALCQISLKTEIERKAIDQAIVDLQRGDLNKLNQLEPDLCIRCLESLSPIDCQILINATLIIPLSPNSWLHKIDIKKPPISLQNHFNAVPQDEFILVNVLATYKLNLTAQYLKNLEKEVFDKR